MQQLNVDLVKVKNLQNIFFPINSSFKVKKKSLSKIWNPFIRKCLGIGTYMVLVYVFYRDSGGKHYLEQRWNFWLCNFASALHFARWTFPSPLKCRSIFLYLALKINSLSKIAVQKIGQAANHFEFYIRGNIVLIRLNDIWN